MSHLIQWRSKSRKRIGPLLVRAVVPCTSIRASKVSAVETATLGAFEDEVCSAVQR